MIRKPAYGGEGGVGVALVSWLLSTLPTGRGEFVLGVPDAAPHAGLVVSVSPSGWVVWDLAAGRPVAAIDATGEAWFSDDILNDPAIGVALVSRGYRRGEMRITRRVVSPNDGAVATLRATQWTTAAIRAAAGHTGAVWK